jgi:hypothetical protein
MARIIKRKKEWLELYNDHPHLRKSICKVLHVEAGSSFFHFDMKMHPIQTHYTVGSYGSMRRNLLLLKGIAGRKRFISETHVEGDEVSLDAYFCFICPTLDFSHPGPGLNSPLTGSYFFPVCVVAFRLSFSFFLILSCAYQMKNCFLPMRHL